MAFRLKFSARALREIGAAQEWYELQSPGLGEEFIAAIALQLNRLEQTPLLHAEVIPHVRRALLPRFPYGLFFAMRGDLIHVVAVLHDARNPKKWPKSANLTAPLAQDGLSNAIPIFSFDGYPSSTHPRTQAGGACGASRRGPPGMFANSMKVRFPARISPSGKDQSIR